MAASCRPRSSIDLIAKNVRKACTVAGLFHTWLQTGKTNRETPMDTIDRRTILATCALALAGVAATSSAEAQSGFFFILHVGTRTLHSVPARRSSGRCRRLDEG